MNPLARFSFALVVPFVIALAACSPADNLGDSASAACTAGTTQACSANGVAGTQTCANSTWGACNANTIFVCSTGNTQVCSANGVAGTQTCASNTWGVCNANVVANMNTSTVVSTGNGITVIPGVTPSTDGTTYVSQVYGGSQTYAGTTYQRTWIGHPSPVNAAMFCGNPILESSKNQNFVSPMYVFFYANGPDASAATPNLGQVTISNYGYCFSFAGLAPGAYHFNLVAPDGGWLKFGALAKDPSLAYSEKQWLEHGKDASGNTTGSFGFVVYWNGSTLGVASTGADY